MKKLANIGICLLAAVLVVGVVAWCFISQNWPVAYRSELDRFFGEGNWECISEETKDSLIYSVYRGSGIYRSEEPGKYKNWYIRFKNSRGEDEVWHITNHALKINHDQQGLFSNKRLSNKQALILELRDISFAAAGQKVYDEILLDVLSEEEAACFEVRMSYHGGNPQRSFYDKLAKEPWFNVNDVTAENYLKSDLHEFYLDIHAHDYRLEKLTEEQQEHVRESLEVLADKLRKTYGIYASFEIYIDSEHKVEYVDGLQIGHD